MNSSFVRQRNHHLIFALNARSFSTTVVWTDTKKIKISSATEIVCCDITSSEDKKYNNMKIDF